MALTLVFVCATYVLDRVNMPALTWIAAIAAMVFAVWAVHDWARDARTQPGLMHRAAQLRGAPFYAATIFAIITGPAWFYLVWAGTQRPNLILRLVSPQEPGVMVINQSGVVARDVVYVVALWNLDTLADRVDPLPIPRRRIEWIGPHRQSIPYDIFRPRALPLVKTGQVLLGSASITCAECARGYTYIVQIEFGKGGWYHELGIKEAKIVAPKRTEIRATLLNYVAKIPESERIPITARDLSDEETR